MKVTILFLLALLLTMIAYAWTRGPETFALAWSNSGNQLFRFAPVLVIAVLVAGFAETVIPKQFVENWLSDAVGWRGIIVAWLAGIFSPIVGVFALPLVAVLYKAGAGLAVIMTFLTSVATLSLIKVPIEIGFYGWRLTFLRFGVSLFLPLIAGLLTHALVQATQMK